MENFQDLCERRVAYLEECIEKYQEEIESLNMEVKRLQVEKYNGGLNS